MNSLSGVSRCTGGHLCRPPLLDGLEFRSLPRGHCRLCIAESTFMGLWEYAAQWWGVDVGSGWAWLSVTGVVAGGRITVAISTPACVLICTMSLLSFSLWQLTCQSFCVALDKGVNILYSFF